VKNEAPEQLRIIGEIVAATEPDIELWLRGGWAVDFFVGATTREHLDVDFYAWGRDADLLRASLARLGYKEVPGPPPDQQLDFVKNGIDVSFALLATAPDGDVIVAGGPWAGAPWPTGMLTGPVCSLLGVTCRVISPEAQIEIKQMTPTWIPGRPVREKDQSDIERIREAMASRGRS